VIGKLYFVAVSGRTGHVCRKESAPPASIGAIGTAWVFSRLRIATAKEGKQSSRRGATAAAVAASRAREHEMIRRFFEAGNDRAIIEADSG
jgi:hypothetical protein